MSRERNLNVNLHEIEGAVPQELSTDEAEKVHGGMDFRPTTTSPVISRPGSGGTSGNTTQSTTVGGSDTFQTQAPGPRTP